MVFTCWKILHGGAQFYIRHRSILNRIEIWTEGVQWNYGICVDSTVILFSLSPYYPSLGRKVTLTKLKADPPRMLCAEFDRHCPNCLGKEIRNMKTLQRWLTMNKFWSENLNLYLRWAKIHQLKISANMHTYSLIRA